MTLVLRRLTSTDLSAIQPLLFFRVVVPMKLKPITAYGERLFQKLIPGAQNREHVTIKNAGHFLQEDKGEELVQVILDFIRDNT